MAVTRIIYGSTTVGGKMVAEAVDHIRKGRDLLIRATAMMNSIADGGVNKALLEACPEFNIASGQGATFYDTVNGMKTNAATVTDAAIASIDMGG